MKKKKALARSRFDSPKHWRKWWAWYPVKVHGQWTWFKYVYRYCTNTYVNYDDWRQYEYGTLFDVIGSIE